MPSTFQVAAVIGFRDYHSRAVLFDRCLTDRKSPLSIAPLSRMLATAAMKKESDLKAKILSLMRAPKYRPLDKIEFSRALGMKSDHRGALKQALRDLERAGDIARIRKNRYVLPAEADLVTGKLQIHQSGFGFLCAENSTEGDVFISAENTGTAMNGDRVVARITRDDDLRARTERQQSRRKAASFAFSSARTTPSSARCSRREIFPTSCRTIRGWCTTFTCSRSRFQARAQARAGRQSSR